MSKISSKLKCKDSTKIFGLQELVVLALLNGTHKCNLHKALRGHIGQFAQMGISNGPSTAQAASSLPRPPSLAGGPPGSTAPLRPLAGPPSFGGGPAGQLGPRGHLPHGQSPALRPPMGQPAPSYPGQKGPSMQPMGPPMRPGLRPPPQRPATPTSPPPTSIGVAGTPRSDRPGGQQMQAGPPSFQSMGRPPPPGSRLSGVPNFGGGPPAFQGNRPSPLGGGEFVEDRAAPSNRIDPAQMPRPAVPNYQPMQFLTRRDGEHQVPPLTSTRFVVADRGDCSPRCMRATLNNVPATRDLCGLGSMAMAVVLCPLALPDPRDDPVQVVDFGESGPVRCGECKAYMNPHMKFIDGGSRFECSFCGSTTQTPPDYVAHIGPDGRRRDADERPELSRGSVEFVAPPQFMVRAPMLPTHLFLIDVSYQAVKSGACASTCASIAAILDDLQGGERVHVGVVTFDATVHFYSLKADQSAFQMLVMPDGEQPYCPAAHPSLLVPLSQSRELVESALEQIPSLFRQSQVVGACLGGAVDACIQLLKSGTGGKLHVFASSLPKVGKGALAQRGEQAGDRDPQKVQEPAIKAYREMAADAAEFQVSIDLFVTAQAYVDLASLRDLCHQTAGQLYYYSPFVPEIDADQLQNDLRWNVIRPQGWEAVGRLRVSAGLDVERYAGSFFRRTESDMDFPALHSDHSFAIQLRHDSALSTARPALLQYALAYSTTAGQRRIRVHTLALPVVDTLGLVFRGVDLEAQLSVLAVNLAAKVPNRTLAAAKEGTAKATVDVLNSYRKNCSGQSAPGQLVLPEALKLAPLYNLALSKCPAFRVETSADLRALWLHRLVTTPVAKLVNLLYGRLLPLDHLLSEAASGHTHPEGAAIIPRSCDGLTAEKLRDDGIFLYENGADAVLFFGPRVDPGLVQAVLGQQVLDARGNVEAARRPLGLPRLDTAPSRALHSLLDQLRSERGAYMSLRIARRGDAVEAAFYASLMEDKSSAGSSYVQFLVLVHRMIADRNK
ncbi:hypothetical protein WJX75_005414 [Coccomyxa subellipsoidea]|uniref:Uncharacterized protein n=1 Tax=Coccomyxa subellipsoidea TaxID=248742 RepID=A0ABR2YMT7_9CHLO